MAFVYLARSLAEGARFEEASRALLGPIAWTPIRKNVVGREFG